MNTIWLIFAGLVLALLFKGEVESRIAIIYYAFVYLSSEIPFVVFSAYPAKVEMYYFILCTLSFVLFLLYLTLHGTAAIMMASLCEILIMASYVTFYAGLDVTMPAKLAVLNSLNAAGIGFLLWNWLNGKFADNRVIYPRLLPFGSNGGSASGRSMVVNKEKMS